MDSQYELGYWNFRGLAQPIRHLLKYLQIPFHDNRIDNPDDWFKKMKPALNDPMANLPYLKDGDKYIFETEAIVHYVLTKVGKTQLLGSSPEEKLRHMQVKGMAIDIKDYSFVMWYYMKGHFEEAKRENLPYALGKFACLNRLLGEKRHFVGESLTYADLLVFEMVEAYWSWDEGYLKEWPNLLRFREEVAGIAEIRAYRESKEYVMRPFNDKETAAWG